MNLLENYKNSQNVNYWCSWRTQFTYCNNKTLKKIPSHGVTRDTMGEEYLFGEVNVLDKIAPDLRSELIVVLDDGWDVPYGVGEGGNRYMFGSFELSPERFPSFHGTPEERLRTISEKIKSYGYAGLGLWQAVQMPTSEPNVPYTLDEARAFWRERLIWCRNADVKYLKLDWGKDCANIDFRIMIREEADKVAPDIIIEQANCRGCFDDRFDTHDSEKYRRMAKFNVDCMMNGDTFRVYDASPQFRHTTLIARTGDILNQIRDRAKDCNCILNIEDGVYIGAALGCAIGAMRCYPAEILPENGYYSPLETPMTALRRALRWQRIAPPFAVCESDYTVSGQVLTDSYHYPYTKEKIWPFLSDVTVEQDLYASVSRGMPLAEGTDGNGDIPVLLCSRHPKTNASAVFAAPRTIHNDCFYSVRADVTMRGVTSLAPVGIFGHYASLTIVFDESVAGKRIYMQDLAADSAVDVTDRLTIDGNTLTISGSLIDEIGLTVRECKSELPGVVLKSF